MSGGPITSILFMCGHNSVRSPMARALTDGLFPHRFRLASAGVLPGEPDAFVEAVLAEIGLGLGEHRPTAMETLQHLDFDLVVTLSPEAHHRALELTRSRPLNIEYWPTPDPTLAHGARSQILDAYRDLRLRLSTRIQERFGTAVRS